MPAPTTEQRQRVDEAFKPFPNFQVWNSGGGCTAWRHDLDDGGYVLVTGDDCNVYGDPAATTWMVGRYDKDGTNLWGELTLSGAMAKARGLLGMPVDVSFITPEMIDRAIACDDLDSALTEMMDATGVTDGGPASMVFSGEVDVDSWPTTPKELRREKIAEWIKVEASYAEAEKAEGPTAGFVKRLRHVLSHVECAVDDAVDSPGAILNHAQIALYTLGPLVADLRAAAESEGR